MKPPAKVRIGPHTYRIVADRAAIDKISANDSRHLGQCDHEALTITVDPDLAPSQLADTVLHECLHSLFDLIGACDVLSQEQEESVVRRLSPALLQALRANEGLVSWLTTP